MGTNIHMETEPVRHVAQQLSTMAEALIAQADSLAGASHKLDWSGHSRDDYLSEMKRLSHMLIKAGEAGQILSHRLLREVNEWESADNNGVESFIDFGVGFAILAADVQLLSASLDGQVLGASSTEDSSWSEAYQQMSWKERFDEQTRLEQEYLKLEEEIPAKLNDLDAQIHKLEADRAELEKKAQDFWNRIVPDWPLEWDSDGEVPWRVLADDYEDQMAEIDGQLSQLRIQRETEGNKLETIKAQRESLNQIISQGIPADGPSTKHPYFPDGQCTKYASSKRYFPDQVSGHAYKWNDQASTAGYEIGNIPVKGAIIVWEPDAKFGGYSSHETLGHVAFIEGVTREADGSYRVSFTDNRNPSTPQERIYRPGDPGISFIYDKKKD